MRINLLDEYVESFQTQWYPLVEKTEVECMQITLKTNHLICSLLQSSAELLFTLCVHSPGQSPVIMKSSLPGGMTMPLLVICPVVRTPARCCWGSSVYVNLIPELSRTPASSITYYSPVSCKVLYSHLNPDLDCHSAFLKWHTVDFHVLQWDKRYP